MSTDTVVSLKEVSHQYGDTQALKNVSLDIPCGQRVGFIGPDGVGKSTLLGLIAGVKKGQSGQCQVLGTDIQDSKQRTKMCSRIAYMPQGLGKNLYMTLSVHENLLFFARLFNLPANEREQRIQLLLKSTGLSEFRDRPAGQLSGGMKQKLGLCCALIHNPDLLILDEPTTGVDPLSRRQFWTLIDQIRAQRPQMSVLIATAYMDEAAGFDFLIAMDEGVVMATGTPEALIEQTGQDDLDQAFIALLPEDKRQGHKAVTVPPRQQSEKIAISARNLSKTFGDFTAVDNVNFEIERGEIFGFLGSNGCGKTTTMKMLTGLLPTSSGEALLFGELVDANDMATRRRVGFMSQSFSLYEELSVSQNLFLHARLFNLAKDYQHKRVEALLQEFELERYQKQSAKDLPLGIRQRLSLAVAIIHEPEILILDEPTSGVDPVARDGFWELLIGLSREQGVTIFVSTHFMNEAQRCDRISLMHAGKVLATDSPDALCKTKGFETLEETFIAYLTEQQADDGDDSQLLAENTLSELQHKNKQNHFSLTRLLAYSLRETLEIARDPVRLVFAFLGTVILMFVLGYGISLDVEDIAFAAMDRDQSPESRDYIQSLAGSRYFAEKTPILTDAEMDERMRSGDISMAIEIPPDYGKDMRHGQQPSVSVWVDGSMPYRAETIKGYIQGFHLSYLSELSLRQFGIKVSPSYQLVSRYRYNPQVESLISMVPGVLPILLLMITSMLTALSIVREKELGSITNFYATPVNRLEFLMGKQLPYIVIGMMNFLMLMWLVYMVFDVPLTGSFWALLIGTFLYIVVATCMGQFISAFTKTQIAAIFLTMISSIVPCVNYAGLINPINSLEGAGYVVGHIYPASYYLLICRGAFTKGLGFDELNAFYWPMALAIVVLMCLSWLLLKKQDK